ncbi:MAG TPA: SDR family oxidoreductase [Polyangiaceae bacterium]|nr:SDR family oxidoreductase [Polyangiaceae bacterium]
MSRSLAGKTAVITGVTSGIGRATTFELCSANAQVVGIGRNRLRLEELAAELGSCFSFIVADLAHGADRSRAIEALAAHPGPIDVFVSNAAECAYESPLTVSSEMMARLFAVNVTASVELCQALVPLMSRGGQIVQLSSVAARFMPNSRFGPYAASKAAIEQFTEALRLELHPRGIQVSLLRPGLVDTAIYDKVDGFAATRAKLVEQVPKWLEAQDVAEAIRWLLERPPHVVVSELTVLPAGQTR